MNDQNSRSPGDAATYMSRRGYLAWSAVAVAGLGAPTVRGAVARSAPGEAASATAPTLPPAGSTFRHSPALAKFAQPLRGVFPLDPLGIPVAVPDGTRTYLGGRLVADHYTITLSQYTDTLHPALGPTTLWGYRPADTLGGTVTQRHLGGIIIGERGRPVQITFRNQLPNAHPLPVDRGLMGADAAVNRASVHLHGGLVPWVSDGGPFSWFRPDDGDGQPLYGSSTGDGMIYRLFAGPKPDAGEAEYYYPLGQSARFSWYHDHAAGITRLNAYAGLASALIVRDAFERSLVAHHGLPGFIEDGGREIPLVIQEKVFLDTDLTDQPPHSPDYYPGNARTQGSLWYPFRYDPERWTTGPGKHPDLLPVSVIPEMFGDAMLVNGTAYPALSVEPRRYRLRVLNATQARFLNLQLYVDDGTGAPDFAQPGPDFLVIGTEGGFLFAPALVPSGRRLNTTTDPDGSRSVDPADPGGSLITAPAERWDVVVDFSAHAGKSLVLYNDAPAPYPGGDARNDGSVDPDGILTDQTILRITVAPHSTGPADPPLTIAPGRPLGLDPASGIPRPPRGLTGWKPGSPGRPPRGVPVRDLTLNEIFDDQGRLIQMLGTNRLRALPDGFGLPVDPDTGPPPGSVTTPSGTMLDPAASYTDPPTETPRAGDTEVWRIANLTGDVHPMHFHLANALVLSRQPFTGYAYDQRGRGTPTGLGEPRGPQPVEWGWKETVQINPMEITTIIMTFDLPAVPFDVPPSPRTGDNEYVWHCHILEHEEHDMMRPLIVKGRNPRLK